MDKDKIKEGVPDPRKFGEDINREDLMNIVMIKKIGLLLIMCIVISCTFTRLLEVKMNYSFAISMVFVLGTYFTKNTDIRKMQRCFLLFSILVIGIILILMTENHNGVF